jgi:hypothetical protein
MLCAVEKVWGTGGVESPVFTDAAGVVDAGDGVEGLGVDGLATVVSR